MNNRSKKRIILSLIGLIYIVFLSQCAYKKNFIGDGDFPSFYWGAWLAFEEHRSPYVMGAFTEAESLLKQRVFPYLYPPPSLLAFYPFSLLSYEAAKLLLLITSYASILIFIYLFFFKIAALDSLPSMQGVVASSSIIYVLMYYPIIDNLNWGQINLIVLALLCLAWSALKRNGHPLSIALPLSLAILMKTYPVLLLPLLLIKKSYRAVVGVLLLLVVYAVIAWSVLPRSLWSDWLTNVWPSGGYGRAPFNLFLPVAPWNHSINGFGLFLQDLYAEILWMPSWLMTRPLSYLLSALVLTVTIGLSYLCSRRNEGENTLDIEVSLFLLMMFLVAPLSWEHHLVYILPSALIAIYLLLYDSTQLTVKVVIIASLLIIALNLQREDMYHMRKVLGFIIPIKFYAVFVIWIFFVIKIRGLLLPKEKGQAAL